MKKYVGDTGLRNLIGKIKGKLDEKADKAELAIQSNPNLLDNWYFVGGGSQQGGGQLPINQCSRTDYKNNRVEFSIDRYFIEGYPDVSLKKDGIYIDNTNSDIDALMIQRLDHYYLEQLIGKTVTVSSLTNENELNYKVYHINDDFTNYIIGGNDECANAVILTLASATDFQAYRQVILPNTACKIVAAKFEIGDHQTLAHKENGNWVLNDPPPDYATELAKCQRYQLALGANSPYSTVGYATAHNETLLIAETSLPVTMRARPSIKYDGENFDTHGGLYTDVGKDYGSGIKIISANINQINTNWISLSLYVSPDTPVEQYKIYKIVGLCKDGLPILIIDANL